MPVHNRYQIAPTNIPQAGPSIWDEAKKWGGRKALSAAINTCLLYTSPSPRD